MSFWTVYWHKYLFAEIGSLKAKCCLPWRKWWDTLTDDPKYPEQVFPEHRKIIFVGLNTFTLVNYLYPLSVHIFNINIYDLFYAHSFWKIKSTGLYSVDFFFDLRYLICGESASKTPDHETPIFRYNPKNIQCINIKFSVFM